MVAQPARRERRILRAENRIDTRGYTISRHGGNIFQRALESEREARNKRRFLLRISICPNNSFPAPPSRSRKSIARSVLSIAPKDPATIRNFERLFPPPPPIPHPHPASLCHSSFIARQFRLHRCTNAQRNPVQRSRDLALARGFFL